jgi:hypothetical protein
VTAIEAGKAVLLEKPASYSCANMEAIDEAHRRGARNTLRCVVFSRIVKHPDCGSSGLIVAGQIDDLLRNIHGKKGFITVVADLCRNIFYNDGESAL